MAKTKIEFEVEIPEGYEWTGECRKALRGEWHLSNEGIPEIWDVTAQSCSRYPILRKAEVWKQLTPEKAFALLMSRKQVTFRHLAWRYSKETLTRTIDSIYFGANNTLCIELRTEAYISNVEYLEEA
jgi:hypothetical protein